MALANRISKTTGLSIFLTGGRSFSRRDKGMAVPEGLILSKAWALKIKLMADIFRQ
jgi:hypothetical protein